MELIEKIGAFVGLVAFLGLVVLVLLLVQQARDVRRLREWAGRAPERAAAAAARQEAELEAARAAEREARAGRRGEGRLGPLRERLAGLGRRLPVDPRFLAGGLAAIVLGVGIATSGFGALGGGSNDGGSGGRGDGQGDRRSGPAPPGRVSVAVLNGSELEGFSPVPGLAAAVGDLVEEAGYQLDEVDNADRGYPDTVAMFSGGRRREASNLADDLEPELGPIEVESMSETIEEIAGEAHVALVVGQDNADTFETTDTGGA